MGEERRKYPRIKVKFPVEYRGKNILQNVEIRDLSLGGCFLSTEKIESKDTPVEIYFSLAKDIQFCIEGRVAWVREKAQKQGDEVLPAGMGIEFKVIHPNQGRKILQELIEEKLKNGG